LPAYAVLAPSLGVTSLLLLFVGFLVAVSCWLGYRGNREWREYATVTLSALLTFLLPLLLVQLALLGYMLGWFPVDGVLIPWVVWASGVTLFALWHACTPLGSNSGSSVIVSDGYSGLDLDHRGYGYSWGMGASGQLGSSLDGMQMQPYTTTSPDRFLLSGPMPMPMRGGPGPGPGQAFQPTMRQPRQHFLHVGDGDHGDPFSDTELMTGLHSGVV
jgi:hypothetical protein